MELFQAFILGMVQGLGEFLPISSSAHLVLAPWVFGWPDQGLAFDIALHWGTLVAVVAYFRKDIWHLAKGFFHSFFKTTRDFENNIYQKLSWFLLLATIPAAIFGKLLESRVETTFRNPLLIAVTLSVVGIILYLADRYGAKLKSLAHITWINSLLIGIGQAVAVIPGISRSGATMIAGLAQGLKREDAAKFSFLMSIPIILGAGVLKLPDIAEIPNHTQVAVGFLSSAVFGFLAIKYMLKYIAKRSFTVFAIYRLALAAIIFILYFIRT
ncbi:undecaprenyl-diphosphate phosphatase [bacterium]|nr:MAG: undecaprenyl-diphosphate phosphatase [bacterium]